MSLFSVLSFSRRGHSIATLCDCLRCFCTHGRTPLAWRTSSRGWWSSGGRRRSTSATSVGTTRPTSATSTTTRTSTSKPCSPSSTPLAFPHRSDRKASGRKKSCSTRYTKHSLHGSSAANKLIQQAGRPLLTMKWGTVWTGLTVLCESM